jgi:hypothetical protein
MRDHMRVQNDVRLKSDAMGQNIMSKVMQRAALGIVALAFASAAMAQAPASQADAQSKRRYQVRVMEGGMMASALSRIAGISTSKNRP